MLLDIPGNDSGDKIIFILFFLGMIFLFFIVSKYLFGKDSYWYYWRYWNPFTMVFKSRFTIPWFIRFILTIVLLHVAYFIYLRRYDDIYGVENSISISLISLSAAIIWYAFCSWLVAIEDDSTPDSEINIEKAKRYYGKIKEKKEDVGYDEPNDIKKDSPTDINLLSNDLRELNKLKEDGILTEEEFNEQKKKLLKQ